MENQTVVETQGRLTTNDPREKIVNVQCLGMFYTEDAGLIKVLCVKIRVERPQKTEYRPRADYK